MNLRLRLLSTLIWIPFVLLWLILWPFAFLYGLILLVIASYVLVRKGRDILIIENSGAGALEFMDRLNALELPKHRLMSLDYARSKRWPWWSLPVRLFWQFGPIPMPAFLVTRNLPAVLVLRNFRRPKRFSFGPATKDAKAEFEKFVAEALKR